MSSKWSWKVLKLTSNLQRPWCMYRCHFGHMTYVALQNWHYKTEFNPDNLFLNLTRLQPFENIVSKRVVKLSLFRQQALFWNSASTSQMTELRGAGRVSQPIPELLYMTSCEWECWMHHLHPPYRQRERAVSAEEPLQHQQVIFILSCFLSPPVPYLFLSSQVHVLIIHIATGVCVRVSTVKYKKRVPGRLPRMRADNDFS